MLRIHKVWLLGFDTKKYAEEYQPKSTTKKLLIKKIKFKLLNKKDYKILLNGQKEVNYFDTYSLFIKNSKSLRNVYDKNPHHRLPPPGDPDLDPIIIIAVNPIFVNLDIPICITR